MHQLINKKIIIYFFLFVLFASLNNKNLNYLDFLKIKKINISGLDNESSSKLLKELSLFKGEGLLFFDKFQIKEILNSNDMIEKFSIFKKYPSTLEIKIKKVKILAHTKKDNANFFIGSNGKLIKIKDIEQRVPFIFGNFEVEDFLKLEKKIKKSKLETHQIKNLFFFKSGRWDIEMLNGILIKLPRKKIKESLDLSVTILNDNNFEDIRIIDLRQRDQVIING